MKKKKPDYAAIGRLGGLATSEAKAKAVRENGRKSKGAPLGNKNATGERRIYRCVICAWSGKRRDANKRCPKCRALVK